jgi:hypothetical protein
VFDAKNSPLEVVDHRTACGADEARQKGPLAWRRFMLTDLTKGCCHSDRVAVAVQFGRQYRTWMEAGKWGAVVNPIVAVAVRSGRGGVASHSLPGADHARRGSGRLGGDRRKEQKRENSLNRRRKKIIWEKKLELPQAAGSGVQNFVLTSNEVRLGSELNGVLVEIVHPPASDPVTGDQWWSVTIE